MKWDEGYVMTLVMTQQSHDIPAEMRHDITAELCCIVMLLCGCLPAK